jgi:hypothetical protein
MTSGSCTALLNDDGVYDDSSGGVLRGEIYSRILWRFQFLNELNLFPEVDHHKPFSINIFGTPNTEGPSFTSCFNLFHPRTIDESLAHDGKGGIPGIKTSDGLWETRGHRSRLVQFARDELILFSRLYGGGEPNQAMLPYVHSKEVLTVIKKLGKGHSRFAGIPIVT